MMLNFRSLNILKKNALKTYDLKMRDQSTLLLTLKS